MGIIILTVLILFELTYVIVQKFFSRYAPMLPQLGMATAILVTGTLGVVSFLRGEAYESPVKIWEDTKNQNNPENTAPCISCANSFIRSGNTKKTVEFAKKAIKADPTRSNSYHNMGVAYFKLGKKRRSLSCTLQSRRD